MADNKETVTLKTALGMTEYTREDFMDAWMKPAYTVNNLLLQSDDQEDLLMAQKLLTKCRKLTREKFDRLYKEQNLKKGAKDE